MWRERGKRLAAGILSLALLLQISAASVFAAEMQPENGSSNEITDVEPEPSGEPEAAADPDISVEEPETDGTEEPEKPETPEEPEEPETPPVTGMDAFDTSEITISWSVYVSDVSTGSSVSINNQRMWAASVVKLYVMVAVMEALENGTLKNSSEIQNELYNMITVSSNDAWVSLAKRLGGGNYSAGMSVVNDWARRNGYPDSGRLAGYAHYNTTSAEDAGHFLERVLAGTNVSASSSAQMLSLLKAQTRTWKIPAGVPSGVVTANKTGELDEVNNDAAIVFAPYGTYVLVVLTSGGTIADIKKLSSLVYAELGKCLQ